MYQNAERAVERVIEQMRANLSEQLTLDDMAQTAMFSKFHFTRIFQRITGVSPGRFLAALRLQEAKRLLISTDLNVAAISVRVGYSSVGTFSTRFTRSVGLPPTTYRRMGGFSRHIATFTPPSPGRSHIHGRVTAPAGQSPPGAVFVGLFLQRIPEGLPATCVILDRPGDFHFTNAPDGTWYLLSQSITDDAAEEQDLLMVSAIGPLTLRGSTSLTVDVRLNRMSKVDPPVLLALLDSRRAAYESLRGHTSVAA